MARLLIACAVLAIAHAAFCEALPLPARAPEAASGSELVQIIERMSLEQRERWVIREVAAGNVPSWNRTFAPITWTQQIGGSNYTVVIKVLPEYLALGTDSDYFLCPMAPIAAQRLADKLDCVLPTRKMVNLIWTNASIKLNPQPIPPSDQMTTVPVFAQHNLMVRQQRDQHTNAHPFGALVSGHKKDVVISSKIYTNFATAARQPVVIYGWHYTSGAPIQPLYNGHSETWADYSHGIRLVHRLVTINGTSVPITNVLTDPVLAKLLHDETVAEGAADGIIAAPNYRRPGVAAAILRHPRSARIAPGKALVLEAVADGDDPLHYEWRLNGVAQGQGNPFVITNMTGGGAGAWTVVITNALGAATSRTAVVRMRISSHPVLFYEDFEPPKTNAWTLKSAEASGPPDYAADLHFKHLYQPVMLRGLTEIVPAAPNAENGDAYAARMAVNAGDSLGAVCALNAFCPMTLSSNVAVKFDCWINYPGGALGLNSTGSTQHALFGLNHSGLLAAWNTAASDGFWFAMSGEGGDSRDYRAYAGGPASSVELLGPEAGLVASNHLAQFFQNLFPGDRFETPGAPGKQWVSIELRWTNNTVGWYCDDVPVATRVNASPYLSGRLMLGLADYFPSIANPAQDSWVLFDNVEVEDWSDRTRIIEAARRGPEFEMTFSAIPGRSYRVKRSSDLLVWTEAGVLTAARGPLVFRDTVVQAPGFYRVEGPL